jgi:hypothetical protein
MNAKVTSWMLSLVLPKVIQEDSLYKNGFIRLQDQFVSNELARFSLYFMIGFLLAIPLDLTYSSHNQDFSYALMFRGGFAGLFFLFFALVRRKNNCSLLAAKVIFIGLGLLFSYVQFQYCIDFPDRIRIFSPMIIGLLLILCPLTLSGILTVLALQLAIWWRFYLPEKFSEDLNYHFISILIALTSHRKLTDEAKAYIAKEKLVKELVTQEKLASIAAFQKFTAKR